MVNNDCCFIEPYGFDEYLRSKKTNGLEEGKRNAKNCCWSGFGYAG